MRAPMGRCRDLFAFPSANAASDPRPCPGGASGNVLCRRLCGQGAQRRLAGTDELTGRVSRRRRRLGARRCNCTMVRAWCERRAPHFLMEGRRSAKTNARRWRPPRAWGPRTLAQNTAPSTWLARRRCTRPQKKRGARYARSLTAGARRVRQLLRCAACAAVHSDPEGVLRS